MKKRTVCLLLGLCLLLSACAPSQKQNDSQESREEQEQTASDGGQEQTDKLPGNGSEEDLPADGTIKGEETEAEQEKEEEKTSEKEEKPERPKAVSAAKERITGASGKGLSAGMEQVVLDLVDRYYQSVGGLAVKSCKDLFSTSSEAAWHSAVWKSLIEIRKASLIDLHLVDYRFTLTCTDMKWTGEKAVELTVTEDAVMYFADTSTIPSEQFGVIHTFTLLWTGEDSWLIAEHDSDDNPYYKFSYDSGKGQDKNLSKYLGYISSRQATRGGAGEGTAKGCDHSYDRDAAYDYMITYASRRNSKWKVYDDLGGNCQNFGSQVLYAGGIPMDREGDAQWYWKSNSNQNYSWINVDRFMAYAKANTGYGLVADAAPNYYDGQVGDILILGTGPMNHTTVISGLINGRDGAVADYLLCSNTSNYRNFPASAYYYTRHWLVHIIGWNDLPVEEPEEIVPDVGEGGGSGEVVPGAGGTVDPEAPDEETENTDPAPPADGDGTENEGVGG